jgi:hypothetical protein
MNYLIKKKKVPQVDLYPLFEADCRAPIARLIALGDQTLEMFTLRIQLEVQTIFLFDNKFYSIFIQIRLEDCLADHL